MPGAIAWGVRGWKTRFISHGGVTLSRGWLCQKWKPLDIQSSKFVVPVLPSVLFPVLLFFHIAALNVAYFECDFELDLFSNSCFRLSLSSNLRLSERYSVIEFQFGFDF